MPQRGLRCKTGCDRCKLRKKKCDEIRPICGTCQRLQLICTWSNATPSSSKLTRPSSDPRKAVVALGPRTSLEIERVPQSIRRVSPIGPSLSAGYSPFLTQTQFDLIFQGPEGLTQRVAPTASAEFRDTSTMMMTVALENTWIRDTLIAFAAYNLMTLDRGNTLWEKTAMKAYQNALLAVRSRIRTIKGGAEHFTMLIAITFLGLSESLGSGDAGKAIAHFIAGATICKTLHLDALQMPAERLLYRMMVECWLFNLATLAFFHPRGDQILNAIDWTVLDACFEGSMSSNQLEVHISPFLGGSHAIYRLILEATIFARQDASPIDRQTQVQAWSGMLDMQQAKMMFYFRDVQYDIARLYFAKFTLHVHALRILLAKVADHAATAMSPSITFHVRNAQAVFKFESVNEISNPAIAWPLIVLLCATDEQEEFDFFNDMIYKVNGNFDEGHKRRFTAVRAAIRHHRTADCCKATCAGSQDGLGLLLHKEGILGLDE